MIEPTQSDAMAQADLLVSIVATLITGEWPPRWEGEPSRRALVRESLAWLATLAPELRDQWLADSLAAIGETSKAWALASCGPRTDERDSSAMEGFKI